jgi:hypothetical protein
MNKFRVLKARLTYDEFFIDADTPKEAAKLANSGKVAEHAIGVMWDHDSFYDTPDTTVVLSNEKDSAGFYKKLYESDGVDE